MGSLELLIERVEGSELDAGQSVILTFSVDGGAKYRSDPLTLVGEATVLQARVTISAPPGGAMKALACEVHNVLGENRTKVIGKGQLSLHGTIQPRMSGGREASEEIMLKGPKGAAGQQLSVRLR
eukprot:CAMPEP_0172028998 /NCGR_PEP_ID=MMETSP1041-20130122/17890_1 /TAXON_ID=464988 /ORGANISM="Hemiselmis andersenii, Strain CCMP439" /LENGTH=124 /DNA_ID=CAMNT_0012685119 /DNA_START=205 /DNA_END=575 /DNA_ORIENTATION=+